MSATEQAQRLRLHLFRIQFLEVYDSMTGNMREQLSKAEIPDFQRENGMKDIVPNVTTCTVAKRGQLQGDSTNISEGSGHKGEIDTPKPYSKENVKCSKASSKDKSAKDFQAVKPTCSRLHPKENIKCSKASRRDKSAKDAQVAKPTCSKNTSIVKAPVTLSNEEASIIQEASMKKKEVHTTEGHPPKPLSKDRFLQTATGKKRTVPHDHCSVEGPRRKKRKKKRSANAKDTCSQSRNGGFNKRGDSTKTLTGRTVRRIKFVIWTPEEDAILLDALEEFKGKSVSERNTAILAKVRSGKTVANIRTRITKLQWERRASNYSA